MNAIVRIIDVITGRHVQYGIDRLHRRICALQTKRIEAIQQRDYYRNEALRLQDELNYRAHRQSVGSHKGWETRKAREAARRQEQQDKAIEAMLEEHRASRNDRREREENRAAACADDTA